MVQQLDPATIERRQKAMERSNFVFSGPARLRRILADTAFVFEEGCSLRLRLW